MLKSRLKVLLAEHDMTQSKLLSVINGYTPRNCYEYRKQQYKANSS